MAIAFARLEYVSRSSGGNSCLKSAYNGRQVVNCDRSGQRFFFEYRDGNVHHEVLLPQGADLRFKDEAILWNAVEAAEKRSNSQLAKDMVIALPDNVQVTLDDKIEMTQQFAQEHFVSKGLAVQIDVHAPHEGEKNWHAHLLITTRRFSEDGQSLGKKARDLDAEVRHGKVVEGEVWGEAWKDFQNAYFAQKGYDLKVDPTAIIGQEHLGPVRMRRFSGDSEMALRAENIRHSNEHLAQDSESILRQITRHQSVFTLKDIDHFLKKHVEDDKRYEVKKAVLGSSHLVALLHHPEQQKKYYSELTPASCFTTTWVREEEERIDRFVKRIYRNNGYRSSKRTMNAVLKTYHLYDDQHMAFKRAIGRDENAKEGLVIIQGRAGTGKSHTLKAIQEAYSKDGYQVVGLAPTHVVAQDLQNKAGFTKAKTVHKMLFDHKNDRDKIEKGSVLIVDEAGMVGNEVLTELLHVAVRTQSKVILVGDDRQLSSVARGGMFGYLAAKYGAYTLTDIRRQEQTWQKEVSKKLSEGNVKDALLSLNENRRIHWHTKEEEAIGSVLSHWISHQKEQSDKQCLIITHTNAKVERFNYNIHHYRHHQGQLGDQEYECLTQRGKSWLRILVSVGDRIQLTRSDKALGLVNGMVGTLVRVEETIKNPLEERSISTEKDSISSQKSGCQDQNSNLNSLLSPGNKSYRFIVKQDNGQEISFNPETFHGFTLGYASTVYKAQGKTVPDVLVYHDGLGSKALSYVGLTRHQQDVHLFVSKDRTSDFDNLMHQMSREENKQASLFYTTPQEQTEKSKRQQQEEKRECDRHYQKGWQYFLEHTVKNNLVHLATSLTQRIRDHYYRNDAFYTPPQEQIRAAEKQQYAVKKIVEQTREKEDLTVLTSYGSGQAPERSYVYPEQAYNSKMCVYAYKIPDDIKQQENSDQAIDAFLQEQASVFMKRYHLKKPEGISEESFTQRVVETYQLIRQQQQEKLSQKRQRQTLDNHEKDIKSQNKEMVLGLEIKQISNGEQRQEPSISKNNGNKNLEHSQEQKLFTERLDEGLLLRCAYMHKQIYKTAKQMRLPDVDKMTAEQESRLMKTLSTESKIWLKEARVHPHQGTSYHYDHCRQAIDMVSKSSQAQATQELSPHTDSHHTQSLALFKAIQQSLHQSLQQHTLEHQKQIQQERARGMELSLSF